MKKSLLLLTLLLLSAAWSGVDARWIIGGRKPASDIKVGDTVVIEQASKDTKLGFYLRAVSTSDGFEVLEGTGVGDEATIVVEAGPQDIRTQAPTVYLKFLQNGKYIGKGTGSDGPTLVTDPANAANFQILDCGQDIPWSNTYAWDDYKEGVLRDGMTGSEVANWRSLTNGGSRGSDSLSVGFCLSTSATEFTYLAYWFGSDPHTLFWTYTDTNQWNVYSATYEKTLQDDLTDLINSYTAEGATEFTPGTDPGYYQTDKVDAYNTALEQALVTSATSGLSDDDYQTAINNLRAAHDEAAASLIPLTEGYYFMVSAFDEFLNNFGVEKAAYIDAGTNSFRYRTFDADNVDFALHITPSGTTDEFYLQSYANDLYVGANPQWYNAPPAITVDPEEAQNFRLRFTGMWYIGSHTWHGTSYTPYGSSSPVATDSQGTLTTWGQWNDDCTITNHSNLWNLRRISEAKMDTFAYQKAQVERDLELSSLVNQANELYTKLFVLETDYQKPLITTVSGGADETPGEDNQLTFSTIRRQGIDGADKYEYLLDGDTTTYMQGSGYISIKLTEPKQYVTFVYNKRGATATRPSAGTWGRQERPKLVNIYGANTLEGDTVYGEPVASGVDMGVLPLPATYSLNMGRPVNRIAYEVRSNNNGARFFTLSEFQVYEATINQEQSQYYTVEGIQAPAEAMKTLAAAKKAIADSSLTTPDDIEEMQQAIAAVRTLYSDSTDLIDLIAQAQALADTPAGEDLGQVSDASAVATLQAAIQSAREKGLSLTASKSDLDEAISSLTAAIAAFTAQINTFQQGKWYFILNADQTEGSTKAGKALYMSGFGNTSEVKVGKVTDNNPDYTYDPTCMWRFLKADSLSHYYIQNLGTGFYLPIGGASGSNVLQSYQPQAYGISFAGNGTFAITPQVSNSHSYVIAAKGENAVYQSLGSADSTTWNLQEINPTETQYITVKDFRNNSMDVFAVPYNVSQVNELNDDCHLYGIRKMSRDTTTDETTIEFYELDSISASQPAFFVFGNPENDAEAMELLIPFPTEVVDSLIPENGLYGMLKPEHIEPGIAYAGGNGLLLSGTDGTNISAHTGAIDPKYYKGEIRGVETALTLKVTGLVWPDVIPDKADVNGDGQVNSSDVVAIYNYISDPASSGLTLEQADVNEDGQVNSSDAVAVYNQIAGASAAAKGFSTLLKLK